MAAVATVEHPWAFFDSYKKVLRCLVVKKRCTELSHSLKQCLSTVVMSRWELYYRCTPFRWKSNCAQLVICSNDPFCLYCTICKCAPVEASFV